LGNSRTKGFGRKGSKAPLEGRKGSYFYELAGSRDYLGEVRQEMIINMFKSRVPWEGIIIFWEIAITAFIAIAGITGMWYSYDANSFLVGFWQVTASIYLALLFISTHYHTASAKRMMDSLDYFSTAALVLIKENEALKELNRKK